MRKKACRRCSLIDTAVQLRNVPDAQMLFRDVRAALLRMDGVSYRKITERVYGRKGLSKQAANNFSRKRIAKLILHKDFPCPKHAQPVLTKRPAEARVAVEPPVVEKVRTEDTSPAQFERAGFRDTFFDSLEPHELLALRGRVRAALLRKGVR